MSAGAVEAGTLISGRYRLERLIARGGMGSVWEATHTQLEVRVAVKFMDPELASNTDARERFEREAKAAAQLRSPHVVQVLDYGVDGERPFIVMEKLEGQDLRARLRREARMPLADACRILNQACKALRLAADAGIVHRDLKPGNIFLCKSGDDEVVKILDFGVAKAARGRIGGDGTKSGILLGSPHYMSPEQARGGKSLDHRSDLWSMAVILFQMLTGEKPFAGDDLGDVIVKICSDPVPLPSGLAPELPASIDRFFARALDRDPAARFQSAREMAASFQALVAQHLGIAESELSSSGMLSPERVAAHGAQKSAPAGAQATLGPATAVTSPSASASALAAVSGAAAATAPPAAAPVATASDPGRTVGEIEAGTLTRASQIMDAPRARPRRGAVLWLAVAVLVGAGGAIGFAVFGGARDGATDAALAASRASEHGSAPVTGANTPGDGQPAEPASAPAGAASASAATGTGAGSAGANAAADSSVATSSAPGASGVAGAASAHGVALGAQPTAAHGKTNTTTTPPKTGAPPASGTSTHPVLGI